MQTLKSIDAAAKNASKSCNDEFMLDCPCSNPHHLTRLLTLFLTSPSTLATTPTGYHTTRSRTNTTLSASHNGMQRVPLTPLYSNRHNKGCKHKSTQNALKIDAVVNAVASCAQTSEPLICHWILHHRICDRMQLLEKYTPTFDRCKDKFEAVSCISSPNSPKLIPKS